MTLKKTCGRIAGKLSSVQVEDCLDGGLILSGACSNKGIPILAKEYGPLEHRVPHARILPGAPPSGLGRLGLRRLGNFPGTLGNFGGVQNGIPVITIELPSSERLPSRQEISSIWRGLVSWLIKNTPVKNGLKQLHASEDIILLARNFSENSIPAAFPPWGVPPEG